MRLYHWDDHPICTECREPLLVDALGDCEACGSHQQDDRCDHGVAIWSMCRECRPK